MPMWNKKNKASLYTFWTKYSLVKHRITSVQKPLYLPDLATWNFLFFKLKVISRIRFEDVEDNKRNMTMQFQTLSNNKFQSYLSSSSCRAASTDLPGPLSPPFSIILHSQEVFKAICHISTELLYIGSSWLSSLCSSMWKGPQEYIPYELVLTSPAVSWMSGSFNLDSFHNGW